MCECSGVTAVFWEELYGGKSGRRVKTVRGKMSRRKVVVHMSKNEWRNNGLNFIRNRGGW